MKRIIGMVGIVMVAGSVLAAGILPYPVTVNDKADTVASITAYRSNQRTYRVSYVSGVTPTATTGYTPFLSWFTSNTASAIVTASYSVVSAVTGIVDFTFSPAQLNHAGGRYGYEVGMRDGSGNVTVSRQGVFIIAGSPTATGVGAVSFSTNLNWALYNYLATASKGPIRIDGSTIVATTNADGSLALVATGVGGVTWAAVSAKPAVITQLAATNGGALTNLNATKLASGTVPLARLSGITSQQVATATDTAYRNPASYNAGALTGNVPVAVEQTISHTNLAGANSAVNVQHLTATEKNAATGAVVISRIPSYIPTNVLSAVQSTSNQVAMIGRQIRVTFNTNFVSLAWIAAQGYHNAAQLTGTLANAVAGTITRVSTVTQGVWQGTAIGDAYLTKSGDWTGTFDGLQGASLVVTNETSPMDFRGASIQVAADTATNNPVRRATLLATNTAHLAASDPHTGYMRKTIATTNTVSIKSPLMLLGVTADQPGIAAGSGNITSTWYRGDAPSVDSEIFGIQMFRKAGNAPVSSAATKAGDIIPYLVSPVDPTKKGRWIFEDEGATAFGWIYYATNGNVNGCGNTWSNFVSGNNTRIWQDSHLAPGGTAGQYLSTDGTTNKWVAAPGGGVATNDLAYLEWKSIVVTNISGAGIKAALALANAGDEIYLPAGIYNCSNVTITIPTSNLTIRGPSWGTVLNATGGQTNHLINLGGKPNTTIRDLQIRANKAGGTAYDAIYGNSANETDILIERVFFNGADNYAVYFGNTSTSRLKVRNCHITSCDIGGIYSGGISLVSDCEIWAVDGWAVATYGSVINCHIDGTGGNAPNGILGVTYARIIGNRLEDVVQGIEIDNASYSTIDDNQLINCTGTGIYVSNTQYGSCVGNNVKRSGNNSYDIYFVSGCDYWTIGDNVCSSASGYSEYGIVISDSDHNSVVGNTVKGHDICGIFEDTLCHGNNIEANNATDELVKDYNIQPLNGAVNKQRRRFDFGGPITQNTYNVQAFGYRRSPTIYYRIHGNTTMSTVTLDVVSFPSNNITTPTTNGTFILTTTGVDSTTWAAQTNAANRWSGYKLRQRGVTATNFSASLEYWGE